MFLNFNFKCNFCQKILFIFIFKVCFNIPSLLSDRIILSQTTRVNTGFETLIRKRDQTQ